MDLVSYSKEVFETVAAELQELGASLGVPDLYIVPISALEGDNVVRRSPRISWFEGPSLLEYLEELDVVGPQVSLAPFRFPIQYVIRPDASFRGFAGLVESGSVRLGDSVTALPSGVKTRISAIVTFNGELDEARAGDAVTLKLEKEVDLSRGDLLISESRVPFVADNFAAKLVWMHSDPLDSDKFYLLKHTTRTVRARVGDITQLIDVNSLQHVPSATLGMNDVASVRIRTTLPLFFDRYRDIRTMGSFIMIDPINNATVAAGMIEDPIAASQTLSTNRGAVTAQERRIQNGHGPAAILIENRPTAAELIERTLFDDGWNVKLIPVDPAASGFRPLLEALHDLGTVAVFSIAQQDELLSAIRETFTADSVFSAPDDVALSDQEIAAGLLEQLRNWRRIDQNEVTR
jgi:sulfate adenylyltransferase subunit 1 (EFTu-like GTPase family)